MSAPQYLSRGIDYLGDLGAKLRDLQGYKTLANELIQNADDVPDAFWLYVVDQAETDDFCVHRIQNPAQRATHFMFDDGWRAVAESDGF